MEETWLWICKSSPKDHPVVVSVPWWCNRVSEKHKQASWIFCLFFVGSFELNGRICCFRRVDTATCNTWNTCCSMELTWVPRMHQETLPCMCVLSTTRWRPFTSSFLSVDVLLHHFKDKIIRIASDFFSFHCRVYLALVLSLRLYVHTCMKQRCPLPADVLYSFVIMDWKCSSKSGTRHQNSQISGINDRKGSCCTSLHRRCCNFQTKHNKDDESHYFCDLYLKPAF